MKSEDERKNRAAAIFGKWITQKEHNLDFVIASGYLPVTENAFSALFSNIDMIENEKSHMLYGAVDHIRKKHLRVAPYCRVSTGKEEQLSSYEAQIEYYTAKIAANPEWTMVRMFADEGLSGTSTKKRKEFRKMIQACENGKIDLVITKSVSRFCRNTLDGLSYVRRLKNHGVGVFFEKENVNTLYMDNEMILTFMMSQAQSESESLSGNVKWGHRKNFRDGKVYYNYSSFLGYRKGADGLPEVDPEEAVIVRRVFARYLMGQSIHQIARDLMADGIKTAQGKDKWNDSVIQNMLRNDCDIIGLNQQALVPQAVALI